MFHDLQIGHFDREMIKKHQLQVVQPLDMKRAEELFYEMGGRASEDGVARLGGHAFYKEGETHLSCELVAKPGPALDYIARLVTETCCEVAFLEGGGLETAEEFLANCAHRPRTNGILHREVWRGYATAALGSCRLRRAHPCNHPRPDDQSWHHREPPLYGVGCCGCCGTTHEEVEPMTAEQAIRRFSEGVLPVPWCAGEVFRGLDADNVMEVMPRVHAAVIEYMDEFAASYTPNGGVMIGFTEPTTPEQVELYRAWRCAHPTPRGDAS